MIPVVALVGRPNVGKSTLFNRLTKSKDALVANLPGLTRDRQYGKAPFNDASYIVIDTGGITGEESGIDMEMAKQSLLAAEEADVILFLVDGRQGCNAIDEELAKRLRMKGKTCYLVVNKVDGIDQHDALTDFYGLGLGEPIAIAASQGRGISQLKQKAIKPLFEEDAGTEDGDSDVNDGDSPKSIKLAIIGRPNVGKSTLINRFLGEERVVVFDQPGTTRDSIYIEMERRGRHFTLIDTAGVRRKGKVKEVVEKFSVIKTLQAINDANVVIWLIDARESITEQDLNVLSFAIDAGRAMVMAVNKWDGMRPDERERVKSDLDRRLQFIDFARMHYISALHGSNVGLLFDSVEEAYRNATKSVSTSRITQILEKAQQMHQPPLIKGRRIKMRYAHQGGNNPPRIVIHGNQTSALPEAYQRYLKNLFHKKLDFTGTPIKLELKEGDNPYKDKKNTLSERQIRRKKRLMKFVKRK